MPSDFKKQVVQTIFKCISVQSNSGFFYNTKNVAVYTNKMHTDLHIWVGYTFWTIKIDPNMTINNNNKITQWFIFNATLIIIVVSSS